MKYSKWLLFTVKADNAAERVLFEIFLVWNFDLYIAQWARAIERTIIFVCCPIIDIHPLLCFIMFIIF